MKTKIIYSNKKDIEPSFVCDSITNVDELLVDISELMGTRETVYLIAIEFYDKPNAMDEVYIHEDYIFVEFFLTNHIFIEQAKSIYIQEYESYESAYSVALDMREGQTNLCYDK